MKQWRCAVILCALSACGAKGDSAIEGDSAAGDDSASSDSGDMPGCMETDGELAVAVTVDGTPPSNVSNYRVLVRSGEDDPLEVMLSEEAVATVTLQEDAYDVTAVALDGAAGATWQEFVVVIACARTETYIDMVGIGR